MATQPDTSPIVAAQNATSETLPTPPAENPGFIKRNSLRLSGLSNLVADVLMMWSGVKNKNKLTTLGGGLYTLGGLNLALFGKAKEKDKEDQLTKDTADFMQEKTGHLSEGMAVAKAQVDASGGLSRNAARNTLTLYTAGAIAFLAAGITTFTDKKNSGKKFFDKEGSGILIYGISSTLFKLVSLLVPEKTAKEKQEEGAEKKGGFVNWVREKPLRIFGYGSLVTDTALGIETYQEFKNPQKNSTDKNYRIIGGATVFYLLADFLVAQSNKDPANAAGKLDRAAQERVEALAAEAITQEPKEKQGELLEQVAVFLAKRPEIQGSARDIAVAIKKQMAQKDQDGWVARMAESQPEPQLTLNR